MVAIAPFDWQAHDTYFIVAHLHYVLIGGSVMPLFAGLYYYWPLFTGKKLSDRLGRIAFWLMFVGFNVAFFPMHIAGLMGMPRRVYTYPDALGIGMLNLVSSIGAFVLAAGIAVVVVDLLLSPRRSKDERNPWQAGTLEWLAHPRGDHWGVRTVPLIESRYPIWDQPGFVKAVDEGRFFLPDAEEGKRELIITSVLDARPLQVMRIGGPTAKPMLAAATLGSVFILTTFHFYLSAAVGAVAALAAILWWLWTGTSLMPEKKEKHAGLGVVLPLHSSGPRSPGWWAMFITMMADSTAFASLLFGYLFYWTIHPEFPPAGQPGLDGPGVQWPMIAMALLLASWLLTVGAREWNARGRTTIARIAMLAAAVASGLGAVAALAGPWTSGLDPAAHVYPAIVWVLAIWVAAHGALTIIMLLYVLARSLAGRMTPSHDNDLRNVTVYQHFIALSAVTTFPLLAFFPGLA
jgi:cytochrome c oxidase subunit I+III